MTDQVMELRKQAADEFRAARRSRSASDRETHETKARSYRLLADNEAWLAGKMKRRKLNDLLRAK
ncbi:MAG: hypothetical protein WD871_02555 [Xanthobacteraceae bacterium]